MWGGRFAAGPGAIMQEINASIDFDRRLYRQDIAASKARCGHRTSTFRYASPPDNFEKRAPADGDVPCTTASLLAGRPLLVKEFTSV